MPPAANLPPPIDVGGFFDISTSTTGIEFVPLSGVDEAARDTVRATNLQLEAIEASFEGEDAQAKANAKTERVPAGPSEPPEGEAGAAEGDESLDTKTPLDVPKAFQTGENSSAPQVELSGDDLSEEDDSGFGDKTDLTSMPDWLKSRS
jgi:hypothetical protein